MSCAVMKSSVQSLMQSNAANRLVKNTDMLADNDNSSSNRVMLRHSFNGQHTLCFAYIYSLPLPVVASGVAIYPYTHDDYREGAESHAATGTTAQQAMPDTAVAEVA